MRFHLNYFVHTKKCRVILGHAKRGRNRLRALGHAALGQSERCWASIAALQRKSGDNLCSLCHNQ
jgi:hypothetical protein